MRGLIAAVIVSLALVHAPPGMAETAKHPAVKALTTRNPDLREADAVRMWKMVRRVVKRFKADPAYAKGAARKITPELVVTVIMVESGAQANVKSAAGAKGLMQVIPKYHMESLHKAGITNTKNPKELRNDEKNVMAGVYILMCYARSSKTIAEALARYNAGGRISAGMSYARKVLRHYDHYFGRT